MAEGRPVEALKILAALLKMAERNALPEPRAMTLATADRSGAVTSRMVLLKEIDGRGLIFYTNLNSRKGRQIKSNPRASACFYWDRFGKQVTVDGRIERVSGALADRYWKTRPRQSQISAWASVQSEILLDRKELLRRAAQFEYEFSGRPIPRPPHWSGLRLIPSRIEIWTRGEGRLHERDVFEKSGGRWRKILLYP